MAISASVMRLSREPSAVSFSLHVKEVGVDPLLAQEILVTADFGNPAFLDNDDPVGHTDGGKPV
jgi:hypothetical protein